MKEKKFQLFMINHCTGLTGTALARRFNSKWAPIKVNDRFVRRTVTPEAIRTFAVSGPFHLVARKGGSGRKKKITEDMEEDVKAWIENNDVKMKEIPGLIKRKFKVEVTQETITTKY